MPGRHGTDLPDEGLVESVDAGGAVPDDLAVRLEEHHPVPGDLPARYEVAEQDPLRRGPALGDPHHEPLGVEARVPEHPVVDFVAGVHVSTCPQLSG